MSSNDFSEREKIPIVSNRKLPQIRKAVHILPLLALLYLWFAPFIKYHFFTKKGKPVAMLDHLPQETGGIRYNIDVLKYWGGAVCQVLCKSGRGSVTLLGMLILLNFKLRMTA